MKYRTDAKATFEAFYEDLPRKRSLLGILIINISTWISIFFVNYIIGIALGIHVSFFYFLAIFPIVTFISQIPITISGLGLRELSLVSLFGLFGVDPLKVFSMSLIGGVFIGGIFPALVGFILDLFEKK
jgi:hypothetical protein